MSKTEKFIKQFDFESNLILMWNPWVWKTYIMKKLSEKLPENQEKLEKYWIDDGEFREKITSWGMMLRKPEEYSCSVKNYPLEMCIRAKVLFFDDIWSSENVSDSQKTKLKYILDEREKKSLVTIFSTNLNSTELSKLYWERIKSRVFNAKHKKGLKVAQIPWEDRRKENIEKITL